jgi:hypothetical protein
VLQPLYLNKKYVRRKQEYKNPGFSRNVFETVVDVGCYDPSLAATLRDIPREPRPKKKKKKKKKKRKKKKKKNIYNLKTNVVLL